MAKARHAKSSCVIDGNHANIKDKKSEVKSWILCFVIAVAAAIIVRFFIFELVKVDGPSMEPNLRTGQTVFVEKVSKAFSETKPGQIVIVHYPDSNAAYVKRLIGIEGDRIAIKGGQLYLNGEALEEPYINEPMRFDMQEVIVGEDEIFVLGDNRNHSLDCSEIGPIPEDCLIGHALFVIWPLSDITGLTGV